MHRYIKNAKNATTTRESYPEKLRNFACTLHFYSSKAYEYVRRTFALALPHASVIRKWCANVSCDPGFCDVAFEALKQNVEKARNENKEVICSLLLDEMAIKKHIQLEGKKAWGYVDVGVNVENFDLQPASDVLVLMVVCHNSHWKIPIAYFFIKGLSGLEKANLVNEALIRLHEVKVVITSVTFDGPSAHFSMLKELGCSIDDVYNMKTWFSHPSNAEIKVFCILDVCHMLKLIRNLLGSLEKIRTRDGIVDWTYIKKLYELQDRETLKLANKLKKSHLEWQKQKMKVNLAAEVFSSSIANALEFLHTELQHPDFKEVEPTISFIRRIDSLFDILNSRTPWAKEFKAPLRENNEHLWRPFLLDTCQFLLESTDIGGRPLYLTPRKTPILGFVISICSVQGIFDAFVKNNNRLNYILTHKCSQDHLEIFFSSIRSRNGWNNNPSALQFMHTFKRLLLFSRVSERGGNCKVLDDTIILTVPSTQRQRTQINNFDVSIYRRYNLDMIEDAISDHDYDVPHLVTLNEFTSNVVTCMSGYVEKMLKRTIRCPECMTGCIFATNEIINVSSYRFLLFKNRGGLQIPSEGVVKICETTEKCVRRFMTISNNSIPKNVDAFVIVVAQQLYDQSDRLFPSLMEHSILSPPNEESHMPLLIKNIINCYCKIRFYNLAKTYTQKIQGVQMRQTLTKLILFNHQ